jgi:hypothetical protein
MVHSRAECTSPVSTVTWRTALSEWSALPLRQIAMISASDGGDLPLTQIGRQSTPSRTRSQSL